LIEAYGLFQGRAWAEVIAATSGALYNPFEIFELIRKSSWLYAGLLAVNILICERHPQDVEK